MSDQEDAWQPTAEERLEFLRAELRSREDEYLELLVQERPARCCIGLDRDGRRWVRIECPPTSVSTDDRAAAVQFSLRKDGYKVTIAPTAVDPVAAHYFDEVLSLVTSGHSPGDAGKTALQAWRDLLARPAGAPLNDAALVGLCGELEVLRTILKVGGSFEMWTGWDNDHCDFRLQGLALEVKSTTSANYRRVRIHGLGQLDDPIDGSDLILVLRRFESSPHGRSVPDLVEELVKLGVSRSALLDRLDRVGYSEAHRRRYENIRFVSTEIALRQIDDQHPRLVPRMLQGVDLSSIDRIDYELNLNGCAVADIDEPLESLLARKVLG